MSLRSKIVLIVSVVVLGYALIDHSIQRATVLPSFAALEREEAITDLQRVIRAIDAEILNVDQLCRDRATWDDTYAFVSAASEEERARYVGSNLGAHTFASSRIDLLYLCRPDGRVVWGDIRDWRSGRSLEMRDLPGERLSPNHVYLVSEDVPRSHEPGAQRGYVSGLVLTEHGPMLLASRPVLRSDGSGEVRGTVILGRFLNQGLIDDLAQRTSVAIALWPLDAPDLPGPEREVLPLATSTTEPVVAERGQRALDVYTTIPDMARAPSLLVRARVPRDILAQGAGAVRYALLSTVAAGLLLLLVLLGVLQRAVVTPIATLTRHAVHIGQTEDSTARLEFAQGRRDEIGVLAREFDSMLQKLALSRAAVVETARKAGMSDIANGILHNVGNVLNSVNVSAGVVASRVRGSKLAKLERLTSLAESHQDDLGAFLTRDPKGQHFRPYLSEVTRLMRADQELVERELASLNEGIEHIRHLVSSQQAYAGRSGLREPTDLREQVQRALRLSQEATPDAPRVSAEESYEDGLPSVRLDRHLLMEILVNVLKNAREALGEVEGPHRLRVDVRREPPGPAATQVVVRVCDSGPGIPAENLTRVFNHGFTTKPKGHGFGLHTSANAAGELGGRLAAESPGELGGATFVLELPLQPPTTAPRSTT